MWSCVRCGEELNPDTFSHAVGPDGRVGTFCPECCPARVSGLSCRHAGHPGGPDSWVVIARRVLKSLRDAGYRTPHDETPTIEAIRDAHVAAGALAWLGLMEVELLSRDLRDGFSRERVAADAYLALMLARDNFGTLGLDDAHGVG